MPYMFLICMVEKFLKTREGFMTWNFGTDMSLWFYFILAIFLVFLGYRQVYFFLEVVSVSKARSLTFKDLKPILINSFLIVVVVLFFFVSFGPGKNNVDVPQDGMDRLVTQMPEEKSQEELKKDAENKKPEELKRQDESFLKDKQEADKYIEDVLKKYDKK